jgi:hypothetical protein
VPKKYLLNWDQTDRISEGNDASSIAEARMVARGTGNRKWSRPVKDVCHRGMENETRKKNYSLEFQAEDFALCLATENY